MAGKPKKVVIIDDEEDVVTYLAALLGDNGYEVYSASDGQDGMRIIEKNKPDLVCLDILMPGETGISLYRRIKSDPRTKNLPVVIISGMNYPRGMEDGSGGPPGGMPPPEAFIEKPIKPASLLDTVRSIIG